MKSFEEFCNSNILDIILKYHNEGSSRSVDVLTRLAYEEYMHSPQLRHLKSYYLHELRFCPPRQTASEVALVKLANVSECSVDMHKDNWCLKMEEYLLKKIKRTDSHDDIHIVNSKMYKINHELIMKKYARIKLKEASAATRGESQNHVVHDTPGRRTTLKDYFTVQNVKPKSVMRRKEKMLNIGSANSGIDQLPVNRSSNDGTSSQESFETVIEVKRQKLVDVNPDEVIRDMPCPLSKKRKSPSQHPSAINKDLDVMVDNCKAKGFKVKPGPASKKRVNLQKLQSLDNCIEQLPKLRACPASKKAKYLRLYYKKLQEEKGEDQENIVYYKPPPLSKANENIKEPKLMNALEPTNKATKGKRNKLWILQNAVLDESIGEYVIPSQEEVIPSVQPPIKRSRGSPAVKYKPSGSEPKEDFSETLSNGCSNEMVNAPPSQMELLKEAGNNLESIFNRSFKEIFHPRLIIFPEIVGKIKEILFRKVKVVETEVSAEVAEPEIVYCDQMLESQMSMAVAVNPLATQDIIANQTQSESDCVVEMQNEGLESIIEIEDENSMLEDILADSPKTVECSSTKGNAESKAHLEQEAATSGKMSKPKKAYKYNSLPLANKKAANPVVETKPRKPQRSRTQKKDVYTMVRFEESTLGTAAGLDIEDSRDGNVIDKEATDSVVASEATVANIKTVSSNSVNHGALLLFQLRSYVDQMVDAGQADATPKTFSAFSYNRVTKMVYENDGKVEFYSDYCPRCELTVDFNLDGMRRVHLNVEMNRYILDMTPDQWQSFLRVISKIDSFQYPSGEEGVAVASTQCCIIQKLLHCLLDIMPKVGANLGTIKENTGIGTIPVYMRRQTENVDGPQLNLTACLDPNIVDKLEELAKQKRNETRL